MTVVCACAAPNATNSVAPPSRMLFPLIFFSPFDEAVRLQSPADKHQPEDSAPPLRTMAVAANCKASVTLTCQICNRDGEPRRGTTFINRLFIGAGRGQHDRCQLNSSLNNALQMSLGTLTSTS